MLMLLIEVSLTPMIPILIKLVVAGLILYVAFWALGKIGLPEPFNKIALAVIVLVVLIYCITLLDRLNI